MAIACQPVCVVPWLLVAPFLGFSCTNSVRWRQKQTEKLFLEISQNSQENTCTRVSLLIMLQACEFFEISKNTFFTERLRKTASLKTFSLRRLKVISTEYHVTLRDSKVDVAYRWDFLILIRNSKCWINNISESIAINKFSNENVINPFSTNVLLLYLLKTSENRRLFWCFQGV